MSGTAATETKDGTSLKRPDVQLDPLRRRRRVSENLGPETILSINRSRRPTRTLIARHYSRKDLGKIFISSLSLDIIRYMINQFQQPYHRSRLPVRPSTATLNQLALQQTDDLDVVAPNHLHSSRNEGR